jgi:hypothetical protein
MAPEQDDPLAVVDVRTDVFGLGRLGAMLLCAPAAGRSGASMPLRVGVPPKVADVLRKATAYQAIDRYPDASAFAAALDRAAGTSISGQSTQYFSGARGRRAVAAAITITASVVMAVTGTDAAAAGRRTPYRCGFDRAHHGHPAAGMARQRVRLGRTARSRRRSGTGIGDGAEPGPMALRRGDAGGVRWVVEGHSRGEYAGPIRRRPSTPEMRRFTGADT